MSTPVYFTFTKTLHSGGKEEAWQSATADFPVEKKEREDSLIKNSEKASILDMSVIPAAYSKSLRD